jgi:cell shape-determining protein MreD
MRGTLYTFSTIREHSSHFKTCPSNIWLSLVVAVVAVMLASVVAVVLEVTVHQSSAKTLAVVLRQKVAHRLLQEPSTQSQLAVVVLAVVAAVGQLQALAVPTVQHFQSPQLAVVAAIRWGVQTEMRQV